MRLIKKFISKARYFVYQAYGRWLATPRNLKKNATREKRSLDIGPGRVTIPDFETLNIVWYPGVDYKLDCTRKLPFMDNTFDVVYASHVLEHIPWFQTHQVLIEWQRILKPGGALEIWVPDAAKIFDAVQDADEGKQNICDFDPWLLKNPNRDPYIWANGRLFYGATKGYPSWHKAFFTASSLKKWLESISLDQIEKMDKNNLRGTDHGWINLGVRGIK